MAPRVTVTEVDNLHEWELVVEQACIIESIRCDALPYGQYPGFLVNVPHKSVEPGDTVRLNFRGGGGPDASRCSACQSSHRCGRYRVTVLWTPWTPTSTALEAARKVLAKLG
jgi:hypothetical protein